MKFKTTTKNLLSELVLKQPKLQEEFKEDDELLLEITKVKKKRNLDQNALLHLLFQKLAKSLKTTMEEVKAISVKRYGDFYTVVLPIKENYEQILSSLKYCEELRQVERNGMLTADVRIWFRTSEMSVEQMAHLIDMVVTECEELGIDVSYESRELKNLLEAR